MSPKTKLHDPELGALSDDQLTRDFWLWQRVKGHRFSSDDLATAFVAWHAAPDARRVLDLGCGIGSVLLHLAWSLPAAELRGVEVQPASFELLTRNIARNGLDARVRVVHGDLREAPLLTPLGADFDLITGTPPYFPPGAALQASDAQREYARIEHRGGVEDYVAAGARLLAARGVLVLCGDAHSDARVTQAAERAGLTLCARTQIIPRAGRPALFTVWTLRREPATLGQAELVLRDERGERTPDAERLRRFSGL